MPKRKARNIDFVPEHHEYGSGKKGAKITLSELEAMRLVDYEGMSQIEASQSMDVSRATIQRLLTSGRRKLISSIMYKEKIILKAEESMEGGKMKLAFINVKGNVGGHLGHAKNITLHDFETGNFSNHTPEVTGGGARAKWLYDAGAMGIVLTGSGPGAIKHMDALGIKVFDGTGLTIEEALHAYNMKTLPMFDINNAEGGCHSHTHESKTECCEGEECDEESSDECCGEGEHHKEEPCCGGGGHHGHHHEHKGGCCH